MDIANKIATELMLTREQVNAAIKLLDEGATVPFIARYRKEATKGLDDTQLRLLEERLSYLREMYDRRDVIITSIREQKKLTPELEKQIMAAETKARLEDLYQPFKPKRHTKAQIAIEAGLEPLADGLIADPTQQPEQVAVKYINQSKNINDIAAALDGAKQILMERFAEHADLIEILREYSWQHSLLSSNVKPDQETVGVKFKDYFDYQEPINKVPSHRALAVFRGQKEGVLRVQVDFADEQHNQQCIMHIANQMNIKHQQRAADDWLWHCVEACWTIKLKFRIEVDLLCKLREQAELDAIDVFKDNLKNLLMAAPAGKKVTLGLDPGFRTGVKTVVVDDTGKLLAYTVIYPHQPQNQWDNALATLKVLCEKHQVTLVSIGNGTASRETERLVNELKKQYSALKLTSVVVSEAGASVYSASELAAKEFPDLDVSYRGAISIARRLQDPLAELVKIDPKAIGVGQYQHDVNQYKLSRSLDNVLEDCVNAVGADVNTASVPLLKSIAGLNESVAQNIVSYREQYGRFANRNTLKKVPRMGEKTYEQAIGFLRIVDGDNPLDASAVHPESYPMVEKILAHNKLTIRDIMQDNRVLAKLNINDYVTEQVGQLTLRDIIDELKKPGRDPRPAFVTATFKEGIEKISDLRIGMFLEGVVTNVTNFGAFVDIGVHQDGLVHISQLADNFVANPHDVIKVGQIVNVQVQEVDLPRKRIQLTMKQAKQQNKNSKKASINKMTEVPKNAFAAKLQQALKK